MELIMFNSVGILWTIFVLRTTCMRSDVIGELAVWRHNTPNTKNQKCRVKKERKSPKPGAVSKGWSCFS